MAISLWHRVGCVWVVSLLVAGAATRAHADEIWVAPTSQADFGGLEVASNVFWPVTPLGVVRLAWAIPGDLQTFQGAKVAMIPGNPGGTSTLNVFVCPAQNGSVVTAGCAGPFTQGFTGVTNQLVEVEIGGLISSRIGTPGSNYLALFAFTTPTTTTDHIVGLRFSYAPKPPSGSIAGSGNTVLGTGNLAINTTGTLNTAVGNNTLTANTTGIGNTGVGASSLTSNQGGSANTALGHGSLNRNTSGFWNTAVGYSSLFNNTTGAYNTATGLESLVSNTTGTSNTAAGVQALASNVSGSANTASGYQALNANTTGNYNTGLGTLALAMNATAVENTAVGYLALNVNNGDYNAAFGSRALSSNTTGVVNTAVGWNALRANVNGYQNTGLGARAMEINTSGRANTAVGASALANNLTGNDNTALGDSSLGGNRTGDSNTAIGSYALVVNDSGQSNTAVGFATMNEAIGDLNVAIGAHALQIVSNGVDNIAIGTNAGVGLTSGSRNIYLGNGGESVESTTMRLGAVQTRAFIAGIRGATTGVANAIPIVIDSNGQLGTISSSIRFKDDVQDLADASRRLFDLRPVAFRYKQPYADGSKPIQYGLVAEEVAEVFPELAVRDANGTVETVHYETLNVLLLNEVQKQQRELTAERTARQDEQRLQRQRIEALEKRLNDLLMQH